jgi:hypothetical protein
MSMWKIGAGGDDLAHLEKYVPRLTDTRFKSSLKRVGAASSWNNDTPTARAQRRENPTVASHVLANRVFWETAPHEAH